jgi:hypothetical protein
MTIRFATVLALALVMSGPIAVHLPDGTSGIENGKSLNRLAANRLAANRLAANGTSLNHLAAVGVSLKGTDLGDHTPVIGIISVTFPDGVSMAVTSAF